MLKNHVNSLIGIVLGVLSGCADAKPPEAHETQACATPLKLPLAVTHVQGIPASEDFTFDTDGYLLALSGGHSLMRAEHGRPARLVAPNITVNGRGMRVIANGDVIIADQDRSLVVRVDPSGGVRRLTTSIANPNGVAVGPAGQIYVTDFGITGEVYRLDPETGNTTALARPSEGSNGLAFSPDHSVLYVGDHDGGVLYRMSVAADGAVSAPEIAATGLVRPDGLETDSCGTVYAASWDGKLYAISNDGSVQVLAAFDGPISAVSFGSGKQGFSRSKLYVMAISKGGVYEIDLGRER